MSWDAEAFRNELAERVERFDEKGAAALCQKLIAHLSQRSEKDPYPADEAKRILQLLRRKRMFVLMQNVAEALIGKVENSLQIRRQYAQSLIDQGNTTDALNELESLIPDTEGDVYENAEARGLRGRVYKQLYVNAKNPASRLNVKNLNLAVRSYLEVYKIDPGKYLWHGINAVALLLRARRDGVVLEGYPDPIEFAQAILNEVKRKDADSTAEQWDYATAAEACVALEKPDEAFKWIGKYFRAQYADAFELASTLRQFTEVWGIDMSSELGQRILPPLRAELLQRLGGQVELSAEDLKPENQAKPISKVNYEANYGDGSFITYERFIEAGDRCLAVARIGKDATQGKGTGFLLRGSDLYKAWGDTPVLVTNSHVVCDDEKARVALPSPPLTSDEAIITFQVLGPKQYRVKKILWCSLPQELDATIIKLDKKVPCKNLYKVANRLPVVDDTQHVYIIGHPGGGTLSLSLEDSLLLDHQDPRIHYRTPTEGGSSGSPVFNSQWVLIGLHHAESLAMPMLNNKPGFYQANEGIWMRAIIKAIAKDLSRK